MNRAQSTLGRRPGNSDTAGRCVLSLAGIRCSPLLDQILAGDFHRDPHHDSGPVRKSSLYYVAVSTVPYNVPSLFIFSVAPPNDYLLSTRESGVENQEIPVVIMTY